MSMREQVTQQALALNPEDRLYLADVLERSLAPSEAVHADVADEWAEELERRLDAFDRDATKAADSEVSIAEIRRKLAEHRARKNAS